MFGRSSTTSSWYRRSIRDLSSSIEQTSAMKPEDGIDTNAKSSDASSDPHAKFTLNCKRKIRPNESGPFPFHVGRFLRLLLIMTCLCQCKANHSSHQHWQIDVVSGWPSVPRNTSLQSVEKNRCNHCRAVTCLGCAKKRIRKKQCCVLCMRQTDSAPEQNR